jgi:hypothetical protein
MIVVWYDSGGSGRVGDGEGGGGGWRWRTCLIGRTYRGDAAHGVLRSFTRTVVLANVRGVWRVVVVVVVVTAVTVVVAVARTAVAHRHRPLSHGWWPYPAHVKGLRERLVD